VSGTIRSRRLGSAQMVSSNVSIPLAMATEQGNNKLKSRKDQLLKLSATSMETLERNSVNKDCLTTVRRLADTRLLFGGPVLTVKGRAWASMENSSDYPIRNGCFLRR
jgi:hypothetical protein